MTRILIADDHELVRKGLADMLTEEFVNCSVDHAADGKELLQKARSGTYDLVVTDISMPNSNGLELLKQLKSLYPDLPVLVLSVHPEELFAVRVLRAGASGYLSKSTANEELVKAVRSALAGKKFISPNVAHQLLSSLDTDPDEPIHSNLSDRELEVLIRLAKGLTVSEAASAMSLSVNTISTYRARVLEKLGLKNNAELMKYALDNKLE